MPFTITTSLLNAAISHCSKIFSNRSSVRFATKNCSTTSVSNSDKAAARTLLFVSASSKPKEIVFTPAFKVAGINIIMCATKTSKHSRVYLPRVNCAVSCAISHSSFVGTTIAMVLPFVVMIPLLLLPRTSLLSASS
ncbi:MAG: hypothetical protein ACD_21C00003G0006 [uncultured bacterium]|nr:MAG: hypothetical protein ACD_21C00003G0006 [uncultured bacterium]